MPEETTTSAELEVETAECELCHEDVPAAQITEHCGHNVCAECAGKYAECDDCDEVCLCSTMYHGRCESCDSEYGTCDDCGDECKKEDLENGRCSSCNENYSTCERCGDTVSNGHGSTVRVGRRTEETWCDDCAGEHTFHCDGCDETFSDSLNSVSVGGGGTVCDRCYDNDYFTCHRCETVYPSGDERADDNGHPYCPNCWDERGDVATAPILGYHSYMRPELVFYGNSKEIFYGVELEINACKSTAPETLLLLQSPNKEHVFLEEDASLTRGGYEIITHPHTLEEHRKLWPKFLATPRPGITSFETGQCGMHVHIERAKLTTLQVQKIVGFIHDPANDKFITAIAQREASDYCKRNGTKITERPKEDHKAVAVGTCNATVEIRIFRGVLRPDRFWKNLEFVDAMVHWTQATSITQLTYQSFVAYVVKHSGEYKHLHNYLTETGYVPKPRLTLKEILKQCA